MSDSNPAWIEGLSEEDLNFLKRFVLSSGSLKELARIYEVSYPTIRLRLDRLIEKIKIHDAENEESPFEKHLRSLLADGRLDGESFRSILQSHRESNTENQLET